jgi:phosphoribosylglycinamide formyltransferase 1
MSKLKIGVLISGGGSNLQSLIDNVKNNTIHAEISVVISNRSAAYGLQRAKDNGIENVFVSRKKHDSIESFNTEIINLLQAKQVDLVVLAGYLSILSDEFIDTYKNKIINIHPSLIPSFCGDGFYGLKVHQAALDYGVKISGATVHFVDKGIDTGAVILQESVEVKDDDTAETLQARVLQIEHKLLPKAVQLFCENRLQIIEREGKNALVIKN